MPKTHPQARRAALAAVAGFALIATAPVAAHAADPLVPDPALASCINATIDATRPADQEIMPEELAEVTELNCGPGGHGTIYSFEGLQGAAALTKISSLGAADLSAVGALHPIADLTGLVELNLHDAQLVSLDGVQKLVNLRWLSAAGNAFPHVNELAGLTGLWHVSLARNEQLTDISGLAPLTSLTGVTLANAPGINGDFTALQGKPNLQTVDINFTRATSLEAFAEYSSFTTFQAIGNEITSLKGLVPSRTHKVTAQGIIGPTLYAAVNATTLRANLDGIASLDDGITSPAELGKPVVGLSTPDPTSPLFRFTFGAQATTISWAFEHDVPNDTWFHGNVQNTIERVVVRSDFPEFTVGAPGTGANTLQTPEGEPSKFPVTAWALGDDAPSFLHIDPVTGVVSGTPTEPGTYPFTVIATDELGNPVAGEVTLTVGEDTTPPVQPPGPPVTETPEPPVTKPPTTAPTAPTAPPLVSTGDTNSPTVLWGLGGALGIAGIAALALALPRRRRR